MDALLATAGLIPHARPTRVDIFSTVKVDYKLATNLLGLSVFAALFALMAWGPAAEYVCHG